MARLHFLCCGVIVEMCHVECLTKISFSVKTTIYTSALIMALCCGSGAVAQNNASKVQGNNAGTNKVTTTAVKGSGDNCVTRGNEGCPTASCPDSVLLSKRTDGNYEIRQYWVRGKSPMEVDFTIHFPINSSQMQPSFSDNDSVVKSLGVFIDKFKQDTLMHIKAVKIKAWASPDGVESSNLKLAKARAATFVSYLQSQCPKMKCCAVDSSASVATWRDCLPLMSKLSKAEQNSAEEVINGSHTAAAKEAHLSKMPVVWSYLKSDVLPEFRCAEVEVHYTRSSVVEQRVLIAKPAPAATPTPAPTAQAQPVAQNKPVVVERQAEYLIIEDKHKGVIVEMEDSNVDWE